PCTPSPVSDVQELHVAVPSAPVHMTPVASVIGFTAGRLPVVSARSVQLLNTRTSSAARCTGTVTGMLYWVAISEMLSPSETHRTAWVRARLHCRVMNVLEPS